MTWRSVMQRCGDTLMVLLGLGIIWIALELTLGWPNGFENIKYFFENII